MARVTKDTTIGEVIQIDAGVIPILMGAGMHCVGCPSSAGETLEEAAHYEINADVCVDCGACAGVCPVGAPNPQ